MEQNILRDSWACERQTAEFFDILTHDDRKSNYIVACKREDGSWLQSAMPAKSLGVVSFDQSSSYYVTHNGFNGRKREANRCRQVNALMFDIDCHEDDHEAVVPALIGRLEDAFSKGSLPHPNLFVMTGRGVQLYYVLERSTPYRVRGGSINEEGIQFYRDIETGLSAAIAREIDGVSSAKLDTCVYDFSRVGRIPGSYNPLSGTRCELVSSSRDYYGLIDLKAFCELDAIRRAKARSERVAPRKYDGMLVNRLSAVERLQEHRKFNCVGSRENMCFVFYNTATQLYGPDRAYTMTVEFNGKFTSPLPESDIAQIKRTVDDVVVLYGAHKGDKGYYPLKAATVAEFMHMSPAEASAIGYYAPGRKAQREAQKAKTRQTRAERDARICKLYERGYSQAEVAKKVKCSPRTVFSVLKREGVARGNLFESIKSQFEGVLETKKEQIAKSCQTSWVVKGLNERIENSGQVLGELFENVDGYEGNALSPPPLRC